jgi:hypothetical protein
MEAENASPAPEELRVLISRDGDHWFAQAIEINYVSAGDSADRAKDRFVEGLLFSLPEQMRRYGDARRVADAARWSEWEELIDASAARYDFNKVATIEFPATLRSAELQFTKIAFYEETIRH